MSDGNQRCEWAKGREWSIMGVHIAGWTLGRGDVALGPEGGEKSHADSSGRGSRLVEL
jgi:hypothetical protein